MKKGFSAGRLLIVAVRLPPAALGIFDSLRSATRPYSFGPTHFATRPLTFLHGVLFAHTQAARKAEAHRAEKPLHIFLQAVPAYRERRAIQIGISIGKRGIQFSMQLVKVPLLPLRFGEIKPRKQPVCRPSGRYRSWFFLLWTSPGSNFFASQVLSFLHCESSYWQCDAVGHLLSLNSIQYSHISARIHKKCI